MGKHRSEIATTCKTKGIVIPVIVQGLALARAPEVQFCSTRAFCPRHFRSIRAGHEFERWYGSQCRSRSKSTEAELENRTTRDISRRHWILFGAGRGVG